MLYFAWVAAGTPFSAALKREDEKAIRVEIVQSEDDFPTAAVTILNPKVGLLNPEREQWAWISESNDSEDGAVPLILGRLQGLPADLQAERVVLMFQARPADYMEQKRALAETLKVAPWYDPLWITADRRDDPDTVLEGRTALWHVDRVTHEVTVTDIITGEDGTLVFSADDHFYQDVRIALGPAPVRKVSGKATVTWRQKAMGSVDLTDTIISAFAAAGTTVPHHITSLTGEGLMDDWPEKGDRIGGGWTVGESSIVRKDGIVVDQEWVTTVLLGSNRGNFPRFTMRPLFEADYDVERSYTETVSFELLADVQAVVSDPGDEEEILFTVSADAGELADPPDTDNPDGVAPIGDMRRRSYFQTDRGKQSIDNLLAMGRARLLARARTAEVSFATNRAAGLLMSCRKNAQVFDDRIPGGQAAGKIVGYSLVIDGETGENICRVTIGCTVGQGNTVSATTGSPVYVEAGYVEAGYQQYFGSAVMPIAGEVTYAPIAQEPNDDGVNFFDLQPADVIESLQVINGETVQRAVLELFEPSFAGHVDLRAAAGAVNEVFTEVDLSLVPLNTGPFETDYVLTVSELMVPKTIDLEAEAA